MALDHEIQPLVPGQPSNRAEGEPRGTGDPAVRESLHVGRLANSQRDALAQMAVGGLPHSMIARSLRIKPSTVSRLIADDKDIQERMRGYESRMQRTLAVHQLSLLDMLEDCRSAYMAALRSDDRRLALDAAKYVESRLIPQPEQKLEVQLQGQVNHEIEGTLKGILAHMVELKGPNGFTQGGRFSQSVKMGADAMPGPQSLLPPASEPPTEPEPPPLPSSDGASS